MWYKIVEILYTVNPLYNDIRYNSKIHYNVSVVHTKISRSCIFSLIFPFYSSGKHTFCVFVESPRRGDSNKYTKRIIYKKKCSKASVTDALDGSYQVSLQQQIQFYSKIFGNKHCRYNEGPLYMYF